jgi:hypothetical protein
MIPRHYQFKVLCHCLVQFYTVVQWEIEANAGHYVTQLLDLMDLRLNIQTVVVPDSGSDKEARN